MASRMQIETRLIFPTTELSLRREFIRRVNTNNKVFMNKRSEQVYQHGVTKLVQLID